MNCLGFLDAVSHKVETIMNDTYLNAESICAGLKLLREQNNDAKIYPGFSTIHNENRHKCDYSGICQLLQLSL